jgi:hypothetical protein
VDAVTPIANPPPLDPIARMGILAALYPGCAVVERVVDAPFDAVWAIAGDLEGGVPRFENAVERSRIVGREGDRLKLLSLGKRGSERRFQVILQPGWCWMQSGRLLVAMAARAEAGRTRIAHLEGLRIGAARILRPILRRKIAHELERIESLAQDLDRGRDDRNGS